MPPDRKFHQMKAHEMHHGKRLVVRVSLAAALSTIQMTVRFSSFSPHVRGRTPWRCSEASHLSSPSANLTREFAPRRLCKVTPCIKSTIRLQTSMTSPRYEPIPFGTASVTNPYTGWGTQILFILTRRPRLDFRP
ncbi:hypothetical protein TNCV_1608691 [Trichonephila clavipes]|nr:hypothetical protein TNCV_1608691 [Trichonephila clavipes]